jgi:hypothetical protein
MRQAPLPYPHPPHRSWDITATKRRVKATFSIGSCGVEDYHSPEPLPAHPGCPLSLKPGSQSLWNPFDVEMTKRRLHGIVIEKIDKMSKGHPLHTTTIPALLMPKPTIQPQAHPPCRERRCPRKLLTLVANPLTRGSKGIKLCAHLIPLQPPRYAVRTCLAPLLGQKCQRCRLQKPSVCLLITRDTIRCIVSTLRNEWSRAWCLPDFLKASVLHGSSSPLDEAASHVALRPVSRPVLSSSSSSSFPLSVRFL